MYYNMNRKKDNVIRSFTKKTLNHLNRGASSSGKHSQYAILYTHCINNNFPSRGFAVLENYFALMRKIRRKK